MVGKVVEAEAALQKRLSKIQGGLQKRIDGVDSHTRFLMKYQQSSIDKLSKRLKGVEKMLQASLSKGAEDEELAGVPEAERLERQQLKKRKGEILAALNAQTAGQTLTIDSV